MSFVRVARHCWKVKEIWEKTWGTGVVLVEGRWTQVFCIARIVGSLFNYNKSEARHLKHEIRNKFKIAKRKSSKFKTKKAHELHELPRIKKKNTCPQISRISTDCFSFFFSSSLLLFFSSYLLLYPLFRSSSLPLFHLFFIIHHSSFYLFTVSVIFYFEHLNLFRISNFGFRISYLI